MNRCKIWMIGFFIKNDLKRGHDLLTLKWSFEGHDMLSWNRPNEKGHHMLSLTT